MAQSDLIDLRGSISLYCVVLSWSGIFSSDSHLILLLVELPRCYAETLMLCGQSGCLNQYSSYQLPLADDLFTRAQHDHHVGTIEAIQYTLQLEFFEVLLAALFALEDPMHSVLMPVDLHGHL